jgi:hypothetical protein
MSKRGSIADTLIVPFAIGLIVGSAATGFVICFGLGGAKRLIGSMSEICQNPIVLVGDWLFIVLISVFVASLFELGIVGLITLLAPFPLAPRLHSLGLFIVGAVVASGSTIASCLMIDLGPHPELHFYKGPSPTFEGFVFLVCVIAPFVLLKRDVSRRD